MRRHRERCAFLARRRGAPLPAPAAAGAGGARGRAGAEVEEVKAEEVVICKLIRAVEAAEGKPTAAGGGRKRRQREGETGRPRPGPAGGGVQWTLDEDRGTLDGGRHGSRAAPRRMGAREPSLGRR